ncbi:hypothetical protein FGG66_gp45 [Corynebacterium phage phi674]|uniref:Uncharacterized protein n=1 Tax=Corynebacterium phage phi674 TaxID=2052822 RepID=A0A2H4PJ50_9CAUD|nr:hypothetical protein FGG66_gp45 [Corynebacterium phage phi674]ATW62963.1 hypothetical protein phi674_gp45 [Corynebacterium phage phi674]
MARGQGTQAQLALADTLVQDLARLMRGTPVDRVDVASRIEHYRALRTPRYESKYPKK